MPRSAAVAEISRRVPGIDAAVLHAGAARVPAKFAGRPLSLDSRGAAAAAAVLRLCGPRGAIVADCADVRALLGATPDCHVLDTAPPPAHPAPARGPLSPANLSPNRHARVVNGVLPMTAERLRPLGRSGFGVR